METLASIVKSGIHFITEPIPVPDGTHLKAEMGSRLVGGVRLTAVPCGDGVYACDLKAAGVTPAAFVSRGFDRKITPSHNELFINGRPMFISQYPKRGTYLGIESLPDVQAEPGRRAESTLANGFYYAQDSRPASWKPGQEIWMLGYWSYDWNPTRERLAEIDTEHCFLKPDIGQTRVHVIEGQRFCFYNVREEVTEPGDYCIDFEESKVYFKPYEDVSVADAEIILSTCDKPVFAFDGSRDITIEGFRIEAFRGMGITADHAENITIKDCEICGIGNRAVCVDNSRNVVVTGCHVHDTGDGGVHFYCGDRKTLERGNCVCEYSHFHNVASWDRCYEPPIRLYGVGLTAHHNKIHDCPHSAMLFGGNYISITDNEVYRVVMETGDAGAIYGGRDYTYRGNEVSRNFIHHVGSSVGMGTMGIYNDDAMSGTRMENNVFYKVQRAVFLGGGVDFIANGNVFVDCYPAIEIDGRGQSDDKMWRNMVIHTLHDRFYNIDGLGISAMEEPYISAFPELAKIDAYYKADPAPHIPPSASMENNILCSERKISYTWCTEGGSFYENNNKDITREELASYITPEQLDVILNS